MIKDSGTRREFGTGAHRDCAEGKGRMDLLPFRALIELSKVFEGGAKKYDDNNWRKGIPLSCYVDSACRHLSKWMIGWRDEPHLEQAAWNIMCLIETQAMIKEGLLPADLNDLPYNVLEIEENPNAIPPLKTSNKRQPKPEFVPQEVIAALNDIKANNVKPIEQLIQEMRAKECKAHEALVFAYDELGMYCKTPQQTHDYVQPLSTVIDAYEKTAASDAIKEFAQLEDGI